MKVRVLKFRVGFAALAVAGLAAASPNISAIRVSNVTLTSAEVSWSTGSPATSQVILVTSGEAWRRAPEAPDANLTTTHRVVLDQLIPNQTYSFYVASVDSKKHLASTHDQPKPASFRTRAIDPKAPFDYRLDSAGPANVYAGHDLYFEVTAVGLSGALGHVYFKGATGLPPGVTAGVLCFYNSLHPASDFVDTRCWVDPGQNMATQVVRLRIATGAPTGRYGAILKFADNDVEKKVRYDFNILPPPPPVVKTPIDTVPRIPQLKTWGQIMTELGKKWCDPSQVMGWGWEPQIWYYDGGRTYLQIADYTKKPSAWYPCAFNILNQYRDRIIARKGSYEGWRVFPHGLAMSYWRTGDARAREAVVLLSRSSDCARSGGKVNVRSMRETAYIIDAYVKAEQLGEPRSPYLARAVDFGLGMFDQLFVSHPSSLYQQTFYDGLMAEALIQYYELTQDPRVPPAIKAMLDWLWNNAYSHNDHAFAYNPLDVPLRYEVAQSNLVIPAFAWYWQVTGDPVYQRRGDDLFAHSLDNDISYSGKIFNQNYRWSFDYVRWRSNQPASTTAPSANTKASN